ncbi:hypothetical protein D3C78_1383290 [compost metagenome]
MLGEPVGGECADQIAQQIGRAQVGGFVGTEPLRLHQGGHQRGIGKTAQADTAQGGQQAGEQQGTFVAMDHGGGGAGKGKPGTMHGCVQLALWAAAWQARAVAWARGRGPLQS